LPAVAETAEIPAYIPEAALACPGKPLKNQLVVFRKFVNSKRNCLLSGADKRGVKKISSTGLRLLFPSPAGVQQPWQQEDTVCRFTRH